MTAGATVLRALGWAPEQGDVWVQEVGDAELRERCAAAKLAMDKAVAAPAVENKVAWKTRSGRLNQGLRCGVEERAAAAAHARARGEPEPDEDSVSPASSASLRRERERSHAALSSRDVPVAAQQYQRGVATAYGPAAGSPPAPVDAAATQRELRLRAMMARPVVHEKRGASFLPSLAMSAVAAGTAREPLGLTKTVKGSRAGLTAAELSKLHQLTQNYSGTSTSASLSPGASPTGAADPRLQVTVRGSEPLRLPAIQRQQ
jgi:hypothetical protein